MSAPGTGCLGAALPSPRPLVPRCYLLGMHGPWRSLVCPNLLLAGSSSPRATLSFATSVAISRASLGFWGVSGVSLAWCPGLASRAWSCVCSARSEGGLCRPERSQARSRCHRRSPRAWGLSPQSGAPGSFVGGPLPGKARFQRSLCEGSCVRPWRQTGIGRLGVPAAADGRAASGPYHGRRLGIQAEEGGCGEARLPRVTCFSTQFGPPARGWLCPFLGMEPQALCASLPCAPAQERMMGGITCIPLRWRLPPCCEDRGAV